MHDPRVGRFFAVDPLASTYSYNSPYAFSENRVIDAIELEGLESVIIKRIVWNSGEVKTRFITDENQLDFERKMIEEKIGLYSGESSINWQTRESLINFMASANDKYDGVRAGTLFIDIDFTKEKGLSVISLITNKKGDFFGGNG